MGINGKMKDNTFGMWYFCAIKKKMQNLVYFESGEYVPVRLNVSCDNGVSELVL